MGMFSLSWMNHISFCVIVNKALEIKNMKIYQIYEVTSFWIPFSLHKIMLKIIITIIIIIIMIIIIIIIIIIM